VGEGELTVGEHGRARVSEGERSPSSRELEGEGGEGFYIAQRGKPTDLHVAWAGAGEGVSRRQGFFSPPFEPTGLAPHCWPTRGKGRV